MMKPTFATLVRLAPVMALFSCAPPKAIVVELPPAPKMEVAAEKEPEISAPPSLPSRREDGIRLPDMVTMPNEAEFRATNPNAPKTPSETGAVIARPPTDPPSRPKPEAKGD